MVTARHVDRTGGGGHTDQGLDVPANMRLDRVRRELIKAGATRREMVLSDVLTCASASVDSALRRGAGRLQGRRGRRGDVMFMKMGLPVREPFYANS